MVRFSDPSAVRAAYPVLWPALNSPSPLGPPQNEAAVGLFLKGKIKFDRIIKIVEKVMQKHSVKEGPELEDIIDAEKWAKEEVSVNC